MRKGPKRRIALIIGYKGTQYQGIQINPNANTVGSILFQALCKLELVSEENSDNPRKISMKCSSRTDKGVHASMQVVSLKLVQPQSPDLKALINGSLPCDIRILGLVHVTRGFQAHTRCESRIYEYLLPTYILEHDLDALECRPKSECNPLEDISKCESYRIAETEFGRLVQVLKRMTGTLSFHNYTIGKSMNDPSSKRFIRLFEPSKPFMVQLNGKSLEWIVLRIHGSSFMLHQIRKMIGLAITIMKTRSVCDLVPYTMTTPKVNIPKAPGFSLLLAETCFDGYNRKTDHHGEINHSKFQEVIDGFKQSMIYPEIYGIELQTRCFHSWWKCIRKHFYELGYVKQFVGIDTVLKQ